MGTDEQAKALRTGRLDLAFLRSWQKESGISFLPLIEETLAMARATDFTRPSGDCNELSSYKDLPFIAFSQSCAPGMSERISHACERAGFVPRAIFTADQFDTALRLIAAGLGWSIVPLSSLYNFPTRLEITRLDNLPERVEIGVAAREGEGDRIIQELIRISQEWFSRR
jgi:DNA-binding transcriptional LysR family regulator